MHEMREPAAGTIEADRLFLRSRPGRILRAIDYGACAVLVVFAIFFSMPYGGQGPDVVMVVESSLLAAFAYRFSTNSLEIRTSGVHVRGLLRTFVVSWSEFDGFTRGRWLFSAGLLQIRTKDGRLRPVNVIGALPAEQNLAKEEPHRLDLASQEARRTSLGG